MTVLDVPLLDLPSDRPRPADPGRTGAVVRHRASPGPGASAGVLAAAVGALLARYTGSAEIVLGVVPEEGAEPVAVRLRTGGNPRFGELVEQAGRDLRAGVTGDFDVFVSMPRDGADLTVAMVGDELVFGYATELFDAERIEAMARHIEQVLATAPHVRLGELRVLTPAERVRIVEEWNDTAADYGTAGGCLHELVERWARETPEGPAVRFGLVELGYAQLNQEANQLAAHLRVLGVGPETVVGVLLRRGDRLPVTLLAVLKAGGAYLPLDPEHPADRLAYLLGDAGCELVVSTAELAAALPEDVFGICLDDPAIAARLATLPGADVPSGARPDNLAYVIYTSGSTGKPKGTLVPHRTVVNLVGYSAREYGLGPGDRVLQFANPSFDVSVSDFFATLTSGATLVQALRLALVDPRALTEVMRSGQVSVADIPPAVLQLLDPAELPDLRLLHVGGEALTGDQARRWIAPGRAVYHRYGPTETTVCCTDHRCPGGEAAPPIGGPLGNQRVYVLDGYGNPVPAGITGELFVGGAGVSRGYLERPGLTADRFVPDPFGSPGSRLYRTGDLARWLRTGELEFLGRVDTQIKLHGHRVEPGEVEAALLEHPRVSAAVVDLHTGKNGDRMLVAYLVAAGGAPSVGELREHLRDRLPAVLMPGRVVTLDAIPLTPNGKVDRRALRA